MTGEIPDATSEAPADEINLAEIFGDGSYDQASPAAREFQPWHRPRKQYVRREQWVVQAQKLVEAKADGQPLRYFGLPGSDLLDIRYLHEKVCAPAGRGLVFLGLNSSARDGNADELAQNASLYDVRNLPGVHADSQVLADDFRRFSDTHSVAWERARELGPFDIVNLDLCEGFTTDDPGAPESYYRAIAQVAEFQFRQPDPWVLLITTRFARDSFNNDVRTYLLQHFTSNLNRCDAFAQACSEAFGVDAVSIDIEDCAAEVFLRLMLTAICKWLLVLARTGNTKNSVTLTSSQGYKVNIGAEVPDLVSLAVRFEPSMNAAEQPLMAGHSDDPDYCKFAERIAKRTSAFKDVDADLADDPEYLEELIDEMEALLNYSYDVSTYRQWLEEVG